MYPTPHAPDSPGFFSVVNGLLCHPKGQTQTKADHRPPKITEQSDVSSDGSLLRPSTVKSGHMRRLLAGRGRVSVGTTKRNSNKGVVDCVSDCDHPLVICKELSCLPFPLEVLDSTLVSFRSSDFLPRLTSYFLQSSLASTCRNTTRRTNVISLLVSY